MKKEQIENKIAELKEKLDEIQEKLKLTVNEPLTYQNKELIKELYSERRDKHNELEHFNNLLKKS